MYWDSSALVKLYVGERDATLFVELFEQRTGPLLTSAVAFAEVLSALNRKEREADIGRGASAVLFERFRRHVGNGTIELLPVALDVLEELPRLLARLLQARPPVLLRSADSIHLATAITSHQTIFVAADQRLRRAADFMGLRLLPR